MYMDLNIWPQDYVTNALPLRYIGGYGAPQICELSHILEPFLLLFYTALAFVVDSQDFRIFSGDFNSIMDAFSSNLDTLRCLCSCYENSSAISSAKSIDLPLWMLTGYSCALVLDGISHCPVEPFTFYFIFNLQSSNINLITVMSLSWIPYALPRNFPNVVSMHRVKRFLKSIQLMYNEVFNSTTCLMMFQLWIIFIWIQLAPLLV